MTITRAEIAKEYNVENGKITSPGKFEGEPVYVPHFWDCVLDGEGYDDADGDDAIRVNIEPEEFEEFPELLGYKSVTLWETDNGFVLHVLHKAA